MGFSRHRPKQSANLAACKGVHRDYLEEAQKNTRGIQKASENKGIKSDQHPDSGYLQDPVQAYLAEMRSEAVQARRLAEQIDNLLQNAPAQTRKQAVMTDSTTIDSEKMQKNQRRATDKPRAANVRSSFNPLHPSMELPPEQLIRLLGLESKKIRKQKRKQAAPVQRTTASSDASTAALPPELERSKPVTTNKPIPEARSTHRQREYELAKEQQGAARHHRSLWLPALTAGLICGAAASAYLFWMQPQHNSPETTAAPAVSKVNRSSAASLPGKTITSKPAAVKKSAPVPAKKNDAAWQATIEARAKRLRDEAKQRFGQRLLTAKTASNAAVPVSKQQPDDSPTGDQSVPTPLVEALPLSEPQPNVEKAGAQTLQTPSVAPVVVSEPQTVVTTPDNAPEEITTSLLPAVAEPETTSHDEASVESTGKLRPNQVTKAQDTALDMTEAGHIEASHAGEPGDESVHATVTEATDQPGESTSIPTTTLDTPPTHEGAAELF
jgi:hypothetical protein